MISCWPEKIERTDGEMQGSYSLSDSTPVVRAIIPATTLSRYEDDSAIYRIEETDFFSVDAHQESASNQRHLTLSNDVNLSNLPIVAVLDSGVAFPPALDPLVLNHWVAPGSNGGDCDHGTKVAGRVAFGYVGWQLHSDVLTPRARIIDCNILDGRVPIDVFIQRIQTAVGEFADIVKVYNLSANANIPIEGDEMSIVGYELDALQLRRGVQFFVSSGNHELWKTASSLEDILDDDDSRIAPPADSMHSVVVGAVVGADHEKSLSKRNHIAPYSRLGPGFKGFSKPDLTAFSGTLVGTDGLIPRDEFSMLLTKGGETIPGAGTSFSAPIVAGDYAEILNEMPEQNILLAKALLYHNARPLLENDGMTDEELTSEHCLYGRGISDVDGSKYSSASKVTFVRTGTLNRTTKERVKIYMPPILAAQIGRNVAKVSVTCLSAPTVDRTKGTEYLGAYVRASLKKISENGLDLSHVNQKFCERRQKWDVCHQFSKSFSKFNAGDWQVWLELFSRWGDKDEDVPYALAVTVEDVSGTLDIYSEIEVLNRYRSLSTIRIRADNRN